MHFGCKQISVLRCKIVLFPQFSRSKLGTVSNPTTVLMHIQVRYLKPQALLCQVSTHGGTCIHIIHSIYRMHGFCSCFMNTGVSKPARALPIRSKTSKNTNALCPPCVALVGICAGYGVLLLSQLQQSGTFARSAPSTVASSTCNYGV